MNEGGDEKIEKIYVLIEIMPAFGQASYVVVGIAETVEDGMIAIMDACNNNILQGDRVRFRSYRPKHTGTLRYVIAWGDVDKIHEGLAEALTPPT